MKNHLFKSSREKGSIGDRFRAQRFEYFESLISSMEKPISILDIGGTEYFWQNRGYDKLDEFKITLVNLNPQKTTSQNIKAVVGDATDLGVYDDYSFDIIFSNSVIEHLYTRENQLKMAKECQRLGKHFFVQTPNKFFPIEPHFRLPFFNFWPKTIKRFTLTKTKLSLAKKWDVEKANQSIEEINLLTAKELKDMFPKCEIHTEWLLFFKKSFTVHNFNNGDKGRVVKNLP